MNPEPLTLSQRTLAGRCRTAYQTAALPVLLEAADELDRLTSRPDITDLPELTLLDDLAEHGGELGAAAAAEIVRLRGILRALFHDCESFTIPRYRGTRINVPDRLWAAVRAEARRR